MFRTLLVAFICLSQVCIGQILNPVRWEFSVEQETDTSASLILKANIQEGWHVYSQFVEKGGPLPTTFYFDEPVDFSFEGNVQEPENAEKAYDPNFKMDITWFASEAIFVRKIKFSALPVTVNGSLEFMVCDDHQCLPPEEVPFTFQIGKKSTQTSSLADTETIAAKNIAGSEYPADTSGGEEKNRSFWNMLIAGFLGGLAAFFMPCIFPLLPFTISYFTKIAGTRKKAIGTSLFYGLSIVVIYVTLGLSLTVLFGADILNSLATNGIFNFFFFLLLLVFAASFLGAFEIVLPSRWVNKADSKADKQGFVGIFFMAGTLSLVSFSCTGPIIGTLLVQAATSGSLLAPAAGMAGFSIALALPFTLFSAFPAWMKSLPKSGSWLNSVKVVLGFLELALALKFLSNVDLAYHWNWLDREVFLVLWIIIFSLLGLYLLGKLKLPHDSEQNHVAPLALGLAIFSLSFSLYMVPGLWGAPLKAIAAFLPPQQTQDFDLYQTTFSTSRSAPASGKKYADLFEAPYGLNAFFDYEEGMHHARATGKPVMLDFTGHACVNCRKMETTVWTAPLVMQKLKEEYVIIQLYVDDKTALQQEEWYVSDFSNKKIKNIGNKWADFQASEFNTNSQPYYVLLSPEGQKLTAPQGANYDVQNFVDFLEEGLKNFHAGLAENISLQR